MEHSLQQLEILEIIMQQEQSILKEQNLIYTLQLDSMITIHQVEP